MARRTLPWQQNLRSTLAKSDYSPLFVALAFQNGLQYRHSDFKKFICDDLAKCKFSEIWSIVTLEFNISKGVLLLVFSLKQTFQTNYLKMH